MSWVVVCGIGWFGVVEGSGLGQPRVGQDFVSPTNMVEVICLSGMEIFQKVFLNMGHVVPRVRELRFKWPSATPFCFYRV